MFKLKYLYLLASLTGIMASCNVRENRLENIDEIKEEVKNRKIIKITEADINTRALQLGDSITSMAQSEIKGKLLKAIEELGIAGALEYCNVNAIDLTGKFNSDLYTIKRVSDNNRNPDNVALEGHEKEILEAYIYSEKENARSNVQFEKESIIYTRPIYTMPLCLKCHGNEETDIAPDVLSKIDSLYPKDKATGYGTDKFRGMWVVTFNKKMLIREVGVNE